MKGSTRKKGSTWYYTFDTGTVGGKRQRTTKGGFRTKKAAEAAMAAAITEYEKNGSLFRPADITYADYLKEWFTLYVVQNLKLHSQQLYKNVIDNHVIPDLGKYKLVSITPVHVQRLYISKKEQGYSKKTVQLIKSIICSSLDYAVFPLQYIASNPARQARIPKFEKNESLHSAYSDEEIQKLFVALEGTVYRLPAFIALHTGMRISEILGLTWNDIDMSKKVIKIRHQLALMPDNSHALISPKSEASIRTITFGNTLCRIFEQARHEKQANRIRYGSDYSEYTSEEVEGYPLDSLQLLRWTTRASVKPEDIVDLVCVRENGNIITLRSIVVYARNLKKRTGIDFHVHSLRHTHATRLIESGIDPKTVQKRLGHSNIQTTYNLYVHDTDQMQRKAAEVLEGVMSI